MREPVRFLWETCPEPVGVALLMWVVTVAFLVMIGVSDGIWREQDCHRPWRRIEYVLPGYRLGCWLGGVPE